MRLETLDQLHKDHQGIIKCYALAKVLVWWLGLSKQMENLVHQCQRCEEYKNERTEPLTPSVTPEGSMAAAKNEQITTWVSLQVIFLTVCKMLVAPPA